MGIGGTKLSAEDKKARKRNKEIEKMNEKDFKRDDRIIKLLLLGTGESGKSTIFKQVRQLYGFKWNEKDLREYTSRVYENINLQILSILRASKDLNLPLKDPSLAKPFSGKYAPETPITSEKALQLKALWLDPGFQIIWERRSEYQVLESIEYYMQEIDRIAGQGEGYIPSFQDIIHCRVRTTGIAQERFILYGNQFVMFDVGGQRSERRKWLNCFDNVMTVIYVAAINEYDQKLFEDSHTDRVKEAVKVWKDIVNRDTFQDIGFVLFLNKWDLFQKKVLEFPFKLLGENGRNQDYMGSDPRDLPPGDERSAAVLECAGHMRSKFIDVISPRTGIGAISSHFTTAIDTEAMHLVFQNCQDQLLRKSLLSNGFVGVL